MRQFRLLTGRLHLWNSTFTNIRTITRDISYTVGNASLNKPSYLIIEAKLYLSAAG